MAEQLTAVGTVTKTKLYKHESHKLHEGFTVRGKIAVMTFDAALVALNTINGKVNGVAIDEITFAGDSDTTMAAIAAAIAAMDGVKSATVIEVAAGVDNDRVIEVVSETAGAWVMLSEWVVAAGASQAGITITTPDYSVKIGMPVEINTSSGHIQPLTVATADTTLVGHAIADGDAGDEISVMVLGAGEVKAQCSGIVTPGPVKYDGYDSATGYTKYSSAAVTTTNLSGWALQGGADGDIITVIFKG